MSVTKGPEQHAQGHVGKIAALPQACTACMYVEQHSFDAAAARHIDVVLVTVQPHTAGELMWMQWNWKNSTDGEPAWAAYTCTGSI